MVLDSYSILFVVSITAPALGDGDWSSATSYSFPAGASIAVRPGCPCVVADDADAGAARPGLACAHARGAAAAHREKPCGAPK